MAGREFRRACARAVPAGRDTQRNGLMLLHPDTGRRLEGWTEAHAGCARSNPMAVLAGREPRPRPGGLPASPYSADISGIVAAFNGGLEYLLAGAWLRRIT